MRIRSGLLFAAIAALACALLSADRQMFAGALSVEKVAITNSPDRGQDIVQTVTVPEGDKASTDRPVKPVGLVPEKLRIAPSPTLKPTHFGGRQTRNSNQVRAEQQSGKKPVTAVQPKAVSQSKENRKSHPVTGETEIAAAAIHDETENTQSAIQSSSNRAELAPSQPANVGATDQSSATLPTREDAIEAPSDLELLESAPPKAYSIEHVDMLVEGTMVSVRSRTHGEDARQYNLSDIADVLQSRIELHETLLGYHRAQDGTLMSINMEDGKVRSNRTVLGRLPGFETREIAEPWITLNGVTIMTGTHASEDDQGRTVLTLDDQLKPQFGLELWVNGVPVDTFGNEPRTIGPILLVPLEPIVDALGHQLSVENGTVTVLRQQDQATINLELATGLVSVNSTPRGVAPDMQLADREALILPFGAAESLTGTQIKLVPLTNRVEVNLDNRLESSASPGVDVADQAKNTPLTLESVTYEVSDRGPLRTEIRGHVGKYNFRSQLETAGGVDSLAVMQPGWASLDIVSLEGWNATVGDYNSGFRELSGVGANRIRGGSWRQQRPNGAVLAIAAGLPVTGSETTSDSVSVPTFGGFVAGGRLIAKDQSQDIGLAASMSEDGGNAAIVANGQKAFRFEDREKGLQSAFVSGDVGLFAGDAAGADIRIRGTANYAVSSNVGVRASANYEGEKFAAGAERPTFEGVFDQRNGARTNVSLGANWRADAPIGALNRLSLSAQASVRHQGGADAQTATSASVALNAQIGTRGPTVSALIQQNQETGSGDPATGRSVRLRGVQRFDLGTVTASYSHSDRDGEAPVQQLVATAQANPIQKRFENDVSVQIAPNATVNWDGDQARVFAGASAVADSGRLFGSKFDFRGRFSAFSNFTAEAEEARTTRFLGSLEARYRVMKNTVLTAVYSDDFDGRSDLSVGLRGTMVFNPPRASRLPDEGKGVLNGRVFLDQNRDGVRQADEPGVQGVRVSLIGTRLGLNTGAEGYFTIQNVRQGLYAVTVSRHSLPLGYLVPEDAQPRVTVGSGRRTDVEIPLILSGQVRGTIFVDENANSIADPGEKRLEGQWVSLVPKAGGSPLIIHSASFGQYGFESVDPGEYTLQATISGQPVRQEISVDGKNPFVIAPIPIPPDLANKGGGVDLSVGVIGEP